MAYGDTGFCIRQEYAAVGGVYRTFLQVIDVNAATMVEKLIDCVALGLNAATSMGVLGNQNMMGCSDGDNYYWTMKNSGGGLSILKYNISLGAMSIACANSGLLSADGNMRREMICDGRFIYVFSRAVSSTSVSLLRIPIADISSGAFIGDVPCPCVNVTTAMEIGAFFASLADGDYLYLGAGHRVYRMKLGTGVWSMYCDLSVSGQISSYYVRDLIVKDDGSVFTIDNGGKMTWSDGAFNFQVSAGTFPVVAGTSYGSHYRAYPSTDGQGLITYCGNYSGTAVNDGLLKMSLTSLSSLSLTPLTFTLGSGSAECAQMFATNIKGSNRCDFYDSVGTTQLGLYDFGTLDVGVTTLPQLLNAKPVVSAAAAYVTVPDAAGPADDCVELSLAATGPWSRTVDLGAVVAGTEYPFYLRVTPSLLTARMTVQAAYIRYGTY